MITPGQITATAQAAANAAQAMSAAIPMYANAIAFILNASMLIWHRLNPVKPQPAETLPNVTPQAK